MYGNVFHLQWGIHIYILHFLPFPFAVTIVSYIFVICLNNLYFFTQFIDIADILAPVSNKPLYSLLFNFIGT